MLTKCWTIINTIIYCWKYQQQKMAHPTLAPKQLRNKNWQRCVAGAQEVSTKNSGPAEGPRIIYLVLMACSPCPQKEETSLEMCPCYWQEPLRRPLPGCEVGTERLSQLPQQTQELRNTTDPMARRARTCMALSTCVSKRTVKCPIGWKIFTPNVNPNRSPAHFQREYRICVLL